MQKVRSRDGTLIAFECSGDGPPLLLVHGALATHRRWVSVLPELEKAFTVYAMDRRGRGESGDGPTYSIEREYEDVAAVVDAIGEKVNVVGHSYGAFCALGAALLTTNMRRIVAYEPPPAPVPEGLIERIQEALNAEDREKAIAIFMRELVRMPADEFDEWRSSPIYGTRLTAVHTIPREFYAVEAFEFEPERYAAVQVPTMMLLGGDSPSFARRNAEQWLDALPNSRIVMFPGQQHIAMDTAPDMFVREVREFLTESEPIGLSL